MSNRIEDSYNCYRHVINQATKGNQCNTWDEAILCTNATNSQSRAAEAYSNMWTCSIGWTCSVPRIVREDLLRSTTGQMIRSFRTHCSRHLRSQALSLGQIDDVFGLRMGGSHLPSGRVSWKVAYSPELPISEKCAKSPGRRVCAQTSHIPGTL
jgi:hypothetical protein